MAKLRDWRPPPEPEYRWTKKEIKELRSALTLEWLKLRPYMPWHHGAAEFLERVDLYLQDASNRKKVVLQGLAHMVIVHLKHRNENDSALDHQMRLPKPDQRLIETFKGLSKEHARQENWFRELYDKAKRYRLPVEAIDYRPHKGDLP